MREEQIIEKIYPESKYKNEKRLFGQALSVAEYAHFGLGPCNAGLTSFGFIKNIVLPSIYSRIRGFASHMERF